MVFMVVAMILETVLYVIRTTVPPKLHQYVEERAENRLTRAVGPETSESPTPSGRFLVIRKVEPIEQIVEEIEPVDDELKQTQSLADKKVN